MATDNQPTPSSTKKFRRQKTRNFGLAMSRDFGLALYDPQRSRLFDPRDRVDINVELGDGTQVPYLNARLLSGLFDQPDPRYPWLIIKRAEHHCIQANFAPNVPVLIEHRSAGPDRHFRATTDDREVARNILWNCDRWNP